LRLKLLGGKEREKTKKRGRMAKREKRPVAAHQGSTEAGGDLHDLASW